MHYEVVQLPEFDQWLASIKDGMTRRRLARRLERAEKGNLGDVEPVDEGVSEMREHFGPRWRMYFTQYDQFIVVMLGGGDKSTQQKDIKKAIQLAKTLED